MTRAHGSRGSVSANGTAGVGTEWGHSVPFLLAKSDFILRAAEPQDPRSTVGDIYEICVMRTLLDPAFAPLLRQLARCGSKKVEAAALDALKRMERDDPYPYRASYVFEFRLAVGT